MASEAKHIIYDFDGVILDTVELKIEAFCKVYEGESPDQVALVRAYAAANGGFSRYQKFHHFETTIFLRDVNPNRLSELCALYAKHVDQGVKDAAFIPGAEDCLRNLSGTYRQHVVSAAPEDDLVRTIRERGLEPYFETVAGAPKSKYEEFLRIVSANRGNFFIAVGDSLAEFEAASKLKIPFIAIVAPDVDDRFADKVPKLPDLRDLPATVERVLTSVRP